MQPPLQLYNRLPALLHPAPHPLNDLIHLLHKREERTILAGFDLSYWFSQGYSPIFDFGPPFCEKLFCAREFVCSGLHLLSDLSSDELVERIEVLSHERLWFGGEGGVEL